MRRGRIGFIAGFGEPGVPGYSNGATFDMILVAFWIWEEARTQSREDREAAKNRLHDQFKGNSGTDILLVLKNED